MVTYIPWSGTGHFRSARWKVVLPPASLPLYNGIGGPRGILRILFESPHGDLIETMGEMIL